MARNDTRDRGTRTAPRRLRIPPARVDGMIEEAIVGAYTEGEQAVGFHATVEQHLAVPFETVVLGAPVTVKKIDVTVRGELVAVCYREPARKASRSSICQCRIHHRPAGNGSKRIHGGHEDAGSGP